MDHFELVSEYELTATSPRAIEQLVREFCEDNQNLLLNEAHPFHNQILHIGGTFKEPEKRTLMMLSQQKLLLVFGCYGRLRVSTRFFLEGRMYRGG